MVEGPNLSSVKQFISDAGTQLSSLKQSVGKGYGKLKAKMGTLEKPGFLKEGTEGVQKFFSEVDIKKSASEAYSSVKKHASHAWKMATQRDSTQQKTDTTRRHSLPPNFGKSSSLPNFPTGNSANEIQKQTKQEGQKPQEGLKPSANQEKPTVVVQWHPGGTHIDARAKQPDASVHSEPPRELPPPPEHQLHKNVAGPPVAPRMDKLSNEERYNAIEKEMGSLGRDTSQINPARERIAGHIKSLSENNADPGVIAHYKETLEAVDTVLKEISDGIKERKEAISNNDDEGRKAAIKKIADNYALFPGALTDASGIPNSFAVMDLIKNFQEPTKLDY